MPYIAPSNSTSTSNASPLHHQEPGEQQELFNPVDLTSQKRKVIQRASVAALVGASGFLLAGVAHSLETSGVFVYLGTTGSLLLKLAATVLAMYAIIRAMLLPKRGLYLCVRWLSTGLLIYASARLVASQLNLLGISFSFDQEVALHFLLMACTVTAFMIGVTTPELWLKVENPRAITGILIGAIVLAVAALVMSQIFASVDDIAADTVGGSTFNIREMSSWYLASHTALVFVSLAVLTAALMTHSFELLGDFAIAAVGFFAILVTHSMLWPVHLGSELDSTFILFLCATSCLAIGIQLEVRRFSKIQQISRWESRTVPDNVVARAATRNQFSRILVHELNSPIYAITRFTEIIDQVELNEHQKMAVGGILNEVDRLASVAADIKTLAAFDRPSLSIRPEPHSLQAILDDIRVFANGIAPEHDVIVSSGPDVSIRVDRERIGQVLRNLLTNAVKFSPSGSRIVIDAQLNDHSVTLRVSDEGMGISHDDRALIFEPFRRGSKTQDFSIAGEGIGLYLSKSIVESHGSELRLLSHTGGGAEFAFDLEVLDAANSTR